MQTFTDGKRRTWSLPEALTVGAIKKIKAETGFDFLARADGPDNPVLSLAGDYVQLADVLWSLCAAQAKERGVTAEDFADALLGDALEESTNAVVEAYINFTPNPQRRETLRRMWAKIRTLEKAVLARAENGFEALDGRILDGVPTTSEESSSHSPAPSA